jgi:hypothetical protein
MYASTLPELAEQKFNDIAEVAFAINDKMFWQDYFEWYCELSIKKRAHVCLEWIVSC